MRSNQQKGNTLLIVIIVVIAALVIAALGFVLWRQLNTNNNSSVATTITNFEECKKQTGSKLLETFPEQCVTADGASFTDTAAAVQTPKLLSYCTTGEKLCFDYPDTWKIEQLDPVSSETGYTGDHLSVSDPTGSIKMTFTSGIAGLGGMCEPDGTTTYVLDGTPIPLMTGFKTDYAPSLDTAHVARVITEEDGKFRANLYLSNNSTYTTKRDITDVKGVCFSQFLNGRNAVLSSDYTGSGDISFNSGGSFSSYTTYTLFNTLAEAKSVFDGSLYQDATNLLLSLHYQ